MEYNGLDRRRKHGVGQGGMIVTLVALPVMSMVFMMIMILTNTMIMVLYRDMFGTLVMMMPIMPKFIITTMLIVI